MNIEEYYKQEEIREYIKYSLSDLIDTDLDELHHNLFNTDFYIIGTWKATQWLGDEVFNIMGIIKDYEQDNFGNVTTNLTCAESVVNMYAYIVGEELLYIGLEGIFQGDNSKLSQTDINSIISNLDKENK
tara:strand:- start:221 stop:610 length:390 start_codon:yes stop_codon:yes gene_type:complete